MALSGKTSNFNLSYPNVGDNFQVNVTANDFKTMMESVATALGNLPRGFELLPQNTDLNNPMYGDKFLVGLFSLTMPMTNDPEPSLGQRYLMSIDGPNGWTQIYFGEKGKIYIRSTTADTFSGNSWDELAKISDIPKTIQTKVINSDPEENPTILNEYYNSGIYELKWVQSNPSGDSTTNTWWLFIEENDILAHPTDCSQILLTKAGKLKHRYRDGSGWMSEWTDVTAAEISAKTGNLKSLQTTSKTNLVSAINEVFNKVPSEGNTIKELTCASLTDESWNIDEPGFYLMTEQTSNEKIPFIVEGQGSGLGLYQLRLRSAGAEMRFKSQANVWGDWKTVATLDDIPEIEGDTIPVIELTSTDNNNINAYKVDGTLASSSSFSDLASVVKIIRPYNGPTTASGTEILFMTQVLDFYTSSGTGHITQKLYGIQNFERKITWQMSGGLGFQYGNWTEISEKASPVSVTIGPNGSNADVIYTSNLADSLTSAFNKLGTNGGEIKILAGSYVITSTCTIAGTPTKKVKISGEGASTILQSSYSSLDITYAEITDLTLNLDLILKDNTKVENCVVKSTITLNADSASRQNIVINNNEVAMTSSTDNFLVAENFGNTISDIIITNNYGRTGFQFLEVSPSGQAQMSNCNISNNYFPMGNFTGSIYGGTSSYYSSQINNNVFNNCTFDMDLINIRNNVIKGTCALTGGSTTQFVNNQVQGNLTISSVDYWNIQDNKFTSISSMSFSGSNNKFINNSIANTDFNSSFTSSAGTWGNNFWKNGIDKIYYANGEGMGAGQGDT